MNCPHCDGETEVLETRRAGKRIMWRRRRCMHCKERFTTYERPAVPKKKENAKTK